MGSTSNISISLDRKRRSYALQVTVGNTNFGLLDWCQMRFGGAIYPVFYGKQRGAEYARAKRWRIQNRNAADLLVKCLPHFIIKMEQAKIAIRFQSTYKNPGERANESDRLLREELRQELLALTKRGPKPTVQEVATPTVKKHGQGNLFAKEISN